MHKVLNSDPFGSVTQMRLIRPRPTHEAQLVSFPIFTSARNRVETGFGQHLIKANPADRKLHLIHDSVWHQEFMPNIESQEEEAPGVREQWLHSS